MLPYPAQPRLICLSVCESVSKISFNYSAENGLGPTDAVNKYKKNCESTGNCESDILQNKCIYNDSCKIRVIRIIY